MSDFDQEQINYDNQLPPSHWVDEDEYTDEELKEACE